MEIGDSWTRNAALWIAAVRGGRIPSRARVTNDAIVNAILRHSPRRVLDVGCGEGWLPRGSARTAASRASTSPVI